MAFLSCREAYYARKNEERKKEKVSKKEVEGAKEAGEEASADTASQVLTKGAVLFFKGAELSTSREDIKVMAGFRKVCTAGQAQASLFILILKSHRDSVKAMGK